MQVGQPEAQTTLGAQEAEGIHKDPQGPRGVAETHKDPQGPKGVQGVVEEVAQDHPQQMVELEPPLAEELGVAAQASLLFEELGVTAQASLLFEELGVMAQASLLFKELEGAAQGPHLVMDRGEVDRGSHRVEVAQASLTGVEEVGAGLHFPRDLHRQVHLDRLVHQDLPARQEERSPQHPQI